MRPASAAAGAIAPFDDAALPRRSSPYRKTGRWRAPAVPRRLAGEEPYALTCFEMCLFISNIEHLSVPKTFFSLSSARISRLLAGFWRLFFLMWSHTLLITWLRGSGAVPTIAPSSGDGVTGAWIPPVLGALAIAFLPVR